MQYITKQNLFDTNKLVCHISEILNCSMLPPTSLQDEIIVPIPQITIIDLIGKDAKIFLHKMLTNDVLNLEEDEIRSAAICRPNGRVIATVDYWLLNTQLNQNTRLFSSIKKDHTLTTTNNGVRIAVSTDLCTEILNTLNFFKLRSNLEIIHQESLQSIGYSFPNSIILNEFMPHATLNLKQNKKQDLGIATNHSMNYLHRDKDLTVLRLQDIQVNNTQLQCYLIICNANDLKSESKKTSINKSKKELRLKLASPSYWDWLNIRAGKIQIVKKTSNLYTPQMLNLDLTGAVSFKKGCYPGQEVITRTQYRGKIKRRLQLAHAPKATMLQNVYSATKNRTPLGQVLMAAEILNTGYDFLVNFPIETDMNCSYYLDGDENNKLNFLNLPYKI